MPKPAIAEPDEDDIMADVAAAFDTEPDNDAGEGDETPQDQAQPQGDAEAGAGQDGAPEGDDEQAEGDKESQPRGPDGKFLAKEQEQGQDAPKPEEQAEPDRIIRPPSSWSAAAKAVFANLDPVVQQEVLKREKEIEDGKAQWDTKAEKFNRFDAMLAPHRDRLTLAGVDDFGYLQALIRADEMLRENPQQALPQILRMYGLDAAQAQPNGFQPQFQQQPQPQPDPALSALQRQLAELQERLTAQDNEREETAKSEVSREIEAFGKDPANLYFENVKPEMAALLKSGLAKDLKEAYAKACQMRDDIRPLLEKAKAPPEKEKTKKAGVSVIGAPGLGKPEQAQGDPNRSIEDDVMASWDEATGAV